MQQKNEKRKINFKYNLKVFYELIKDYKLYIFLIFIAILFAQFGRISSRYLFKYLVDYATEFTQGNILQSVLVKFLLVILAIFSVIKFIEIVSVWFEIHFVNRFEGKVIQDLKVKFFNHLVSLSYDFHTTHKTGSLISRLVRGGGSVERLIDVVVFQFLPFIFQAILVIISFFILDWILPGILTLIIAITFISFSVFIQYLQQTHRIRALEQEDIEKANISDIFLNIDSIKHFGREKTMKNRFFKITDTSKKLMVRNWDFFRWFAAGENIILVIGTILMVYFPVIRLINGEITVGTLVYIYSIYVMLIGYMFDFVFGIRDFYRSMADFEDLFQYNRYENEIKDLPKAPDLRIKKGEIEFKNVFFKYQNKPLFEGLNLKIKPNETVALVGHSGCGKSSLIRLLYRLYDIDSGEILVDGKNINLFKQESLRFEMGIVPQECVLFDDTIYNNISFSRPSATRKEVFNAMRFAHLDKIVESFPQKEKTIVGERGVKLSGGEKQRVSIARAILSNKKVLVLDEATSSLDSHTENQIQQDLERLMENRTSIVIAHRLSTIRNADKIVVMDKGKIVQIGSHRKLLAQGGIYRKLWMLQADMDKDIYYD